MKEWISCGLRLTRDTAAAAAPPRLDVAVFSPNSFPCHRPPAACAVECAEYVGCGKYDEPLLSSSTPVVEDTYKQYTTVYTVTVKYLINLDTRTICSGGAAGNITYINTVVGAQALALNTTAGGLASTRTLQTLTWARGLSMKASKGLESISTGGIQTGPVISTDPHSRATLVWSTLDSHKVVPQNNNASRYSIGLSGAFRTIAKGFSHSVVLIATRGGPTAAMYSWGKFMQSVSGKPKVTDQRLSHIGYFTECVNLCFRRASVAMHHRVCLVHPPFSQTNTTGALMRLGPLRCLRETQPEARTWLNDVCRK